MQKVLGWLLIGLLCPTTLGGCLSSSLVYANTAFQLGAERSELYLPLLANKRVGVIVNPTSVLNPGTRASQHLVDYLVAQGVDVQLVFAPEHGFRGDKGAGEVIADDIDPATQLPIVSLYGQTKRPTQQMLNAIDVLVFDIQDVGVRFYTYISTMHYAMEAAAQHGVEFIVLDRPNPNGQFVAGPVLEPAYRSFLGVHPIPIVHGLTVGELAHMIVGENWLETDKPLNLHVIPMRHYDKTMAYSLPIAPSPNLPTDQAIQWYASLCLFEPTHISVGRGTAYPFQLIGHPNLSFESMIRSAVTIETFTPVSMPSSAPHPKWQDTPIEVVRVAALKPQLSGFDVELLVKVFAAANQQGIELVTSSDFFDKLAGTSTLRLALLTGRSQQEIEAQWQDALRAYKTRRQPYLLYPLH
ncbi:DUF1343 domain-containing protein [Glaciecola sp. XM2]|nr:DUF1343 domain-containing protein [Glaciecola sp. XM2]